MNAIDRAANILGEKNDFFFVSVTEHDGTMSKCSMRYKKEQDSFSLLFMAVAEVIMNEYEEEYGINAVQNTLRSLLKVAIKEHSNNKEKKESNDNGSDNKEM